jgi:tripartite-type tricarboxylate transporter receptor subunit TctC
MARPAAAEAGYPSRSLRLIIPYPPGGASDVVGRIIGQVMAGRIGQAVVADNRGGAGGNLGAELAAKADPDGYTTLLSTISFAAIGPHLYPRLGYDPVRDLAAVAQAAFVANGLAVRRDLPVDSLAGLLALARARPGELTYGSSGNGSSGHVVGAMLGLRAGVQLQHVPYRGTGPMLADVIAGRLDIASDNLPALLPQVQDGRMKLLAVTSERRWFAVPEVPTVAEAAGLPGFAALVWWGLQVPAATPAAAVGVLEAAMLAGFAEPAMRDRLHALGFEAAPMGAADFQRHIAAEYRKWGEVVRSARITLD